MHEEEPQFSFRSLFVPFTTVKAIHWIIFIGFIVYANSLFNGFVGDDIGQLVDNNIVHSLENIRSFFFGSTFNTSNGNIIGLYYKPLLLTTYSILYSLFGATSFFYHFFQLILHIANASFVFIIINKFTKKEFAFILSLTFLIHPINADTVDYIANLQDTMFVFFGLISTYIVIYKKKNLVNLIFTGLSFFLSLLSKETGVAFFVIISSFCFLLDRKKFKLYTFVLFVILVIYAIMHILIVGYGFSDNQPFPMMRENLLTRLFSIPSIILYYIVTFLFPLELSLDHQWVVKDITLYTFFIPLFGVFLLFTLIVLLFHLVKKRSGDIRQLFFFLIWFLTGVFLHLQIVPLDYTVANRWFYLPMIGLLGIFGIMGKFFLANKYKYLFILISICMLTLLSVRTIIRNMDWRDGITLARHDLQYSPEDFSLQNYLGIQYYNNRQYEEAIKHFLLSTEIAPYWDQNWNYLGQTYERVGELKQNEELLHKARIAYNRAISNSVNNDAPYANMAHLLLFTADPSAENFIKKSLKQFPHSSQLWYYLSIYEMSKNNKEEALVYAKNAVINNPYNQEANDLYSALVQGINIDIQLVK